MANGYDKIDERLKAGREVLGRLSDPVSHLARFETAAVSRRAMSTTSSQFFGYGNAWATTETAPVDQSPAARPS
jgi:hypothetical protein